MKNEISSLELYYIVRELKVLEGSKIDRIYHSKNNPKELTIGCHIISQGKKILRTILPGIIFLDDTKDSSDTQTGFGMMLRKYLEGGRIKSIMQKDFERVITITAEIKSDREISAYYLILELFSKGNIIFCDNDMKILNILEEQTWKDRMLKRNEKYVYPKSQSNILKISEKEFIEGLRASNKESLVKALAITFNLGGTYAEELCKLSGIEKNADAKTLTDTDYTTIYRNMILLLHKEISANLCNGEIFPFSLKSLEEKDRLQYENFSSVIRKNYNSIKSSELQKDSRRNTDKMQHIIDEQSIMLKECEEGYAENQAKGELIYEKYQEIDSILKAVKDARKKYSWNVIRQRLNDNPEFKKIIKDIDEKNHSIIINIEK
jgi:predicted ribosome quality control (RQC) complex YloA/Tae2 family protein